MSAVAVSELDPVDFKTLIQPCPVCGNKGCAKHADAATAEISDEDLTSRDLRQLEAWIDTHLEESDRNAQEAIANQVEVGRALLAAKGKLRHGEFEAWAKERWEYTPTHCRRLMFLARNRTRVFDLPADVSLRGALSAIKEALKEEGHAPTPVAIAPAVTLPEDLVLVEGDAEQLVDVEDGSVDLVVTSPPFDLGLDYGPGIDDALGRRFYLEQARRWALAWWRKGGPQARLCLNVPLDTMGEAGPRPMYADWVQVLEAAGWRYRTSIVWAEGNVSKQTARGSVDSPSAPHVIAPVEMVIVCHKGDWHLSAARKTHPEWGLPDLVRAEWLDWTSGLWSFSGTCSPKWHPAPFPEELPRRLIKLFSFPGALVLDPFLGSGTTAIAAATLGRRFYGVDRNPEFVARARQRLGAELSRGGL